MGGRFPPTLPTSPDVLPFEEARARVLARVEPLPPGEVPLGDALGCVLAEDVRAGEDLPPFANSAMDGFAVRSADLGGAGDAAPVRLRVAGEVFAGTGRLPAVEPGTAVRIMTGGALPPGADAVVPVERAAVEGDAVLVRLAAASGAFVREAGEDVRAGTVVLERGTVVGPAAVGMLASVGRRAVPVHPRPRPDRLDRPRVVATLGEPVRSPKGRVSFLRVRLEVGGDVLRATLTGAQGSGVLSSCVAADGLAVIPEEVDGLPAGTPVQVVLLREDLAWVA